jgi:hypothetical protein
MVLPKLHAEFQKIQYGVVHQDPFTLILSKIEYLPFIINIPTDDTGILNIVPVLL